MDISFNESKFIILMPAFFRIQEYTVLRNLIIDEMREPDCIIARAVCMLRDVGSYLLFRIGIPAPPPETVEINNRAELEVQQDYTPYIKLAVTGPRS